jgi:hypothetical protein
MKTSELTGVALDWAVAKAEGPNSVASCYYDDDAPLWLEEAPEPEWKPSTDWAQGGPIIERENICVNRDDSSHEWEAHRVGDEFGAHWADTPLIAAMRCYVASKLGDTVNIPEELK